MFCSVHLKVVFTNNNIFIDHCTGSSPRQVPRFITKTCLLDYDSIAGADKFGNIFVLRVPADVSDDIDNPTGTVSTLTDCTFANHPSLQM